ncbi:MAG: DUF1592 domain-containing protein, partial [Candidatus Solibacter sp.]
MKQREYFSACGPATALAISLAIPALLGAAPLDFDRDVRPFLAQYCSRCHNSKVVSGGLNLELFDSQAALLQYPERTGEILRALDSGLMPLKGQPQPSDTLRRAVVEAIRGAIDHFDYSSYKNPGYLPIHRLTVTQYRNTIRDLVGAGEEIADELPADESTHGFDHIAEVQDVSAAHMDSYADAARYILDRALLPSPRTWRFEAEKLPYARLFGGLMVFEKHAPDWEETAPEHIVGATEHVFLHNGGVVFPLHFPHTGLYRVRLRGWGMKGAKGRGGPGLKIKLDSNRVADIRVPLDGPGKSAELKAEFIVRSGAHDVKVEMDGMGFDPDEKDPAKRYNRIGIDFIEVTGPVPEDEARAANIRSNLMAAVPGPGLVPREAARRVLDRFVPLAYRRPARAGEIDKLLTLFDRTLKRGKSYEHAVKVALEAVLTSPDFLLHIEVAGAPQGASRISDFELASRLSYFIWSSMPDGGLFQAAAENRLHDPDVLRAETERMLRDPKSKSLASKFAPQWLALGSLFAVHKDGPFHENNLAMRQMLLDEVVLFFDSIVRENRSILDLVDADYTFVNQRLATHYGIAGVTSGREWTRVGLEGDLRQQRGGVITMAGVLLAHSQSYHTNPSGRGRWILDALLGTPPPPPPPSVQPLENTKKGDAASAKTLRERLSQHRVDPACASCHAKIDPLGFALENYDIVGAWRATEAGKPVDASGQLAGGVPFAGPAELKRMILLDKKELFVRNFAKQMLTYGLRRGLEFYDEPVIRDAEAALRNDGYRIGALVHSIVGSYSFQYR